MPSSRLFVSSSSTGCWSWPDAAFVRARDGPAWQVQARAPLQQADQDVRPGLCPAGVVALPGVQEDGRDMMIRQDNMATLGRLLVLMSKRNDLRFGQLIYLALKEYKFQIAEGLWGVEDEYLLDMIELTLAGKK